MLRKEMWVYGQVTLTLAYTSLESGTDKSHLDERNLASNGAFAMSVIIHQRCGYLGEWANADKIDLLVLLLNFRIVRRKVKLLEIDALERSDGVDEHLTSDTLP
jgi:hypothetical protein